MASERLLATDDASSDTLMESDRESLEGKHVKLRLQPEHHSTHHRSRSSQSNIQRHIQRYAQRYAQRPGRVWLWVTAFAVLLLFAAVVHAWTSGPKKPKWDSEPPFKRRRTACTTWSQEAIENLKSKEFPTAKALKRSEWKKPEGFKIVALMFYGRREYVDILDCYLQRNLVSAGGLLDEVHFVAHARDRRDLKYLDELLNRTEEYKRLEVPERCNQTLSVWACIWDTVSDRDTLYLKIDDDVLYLHEDAIPRLVNTRLKYPNAFAIGANMVNVRPLPPLHYHNGAIHPYLPDPNTMKERDGEISWRPSQMPLYPEADLDDVDVYRSFQSLKKARVSYHGQRWLRLNSSNLDNLRTPAAMLDRKTDDITHNVIKTGPMSAQEQFSLLENLETNQLEGYRIGNEDGIYDTQYQRYNINFLAVWGKDVADNLPFDISHVAALDERTISIDLPKKLGRPFLVDSHVIGMHYSFHSQRNYMYNTDLLDRWRAYANENVCTDYVRLPFGKTCKGLEPEEPEVDTQGYQTPN